MTYALVVRLARVLFRRARPPGDRGRGRPRPRDRTGRPRRQPRELPRLPPARPRGARSAAAGCGSSPGTSCGVPARGSRDAPDGPRPCRPCGTGPRLPPGPRRPPARRGGGHLPRGRRQQVVHGARHDARCGGAGRGDRRRAGACRAVGRPTAPDRRGPPCAAEERPGGHRGRPAPPGGARDRRTTGDPAARRGAAAAPRRAAAPSRPAAGRQARDRPGTPVTSGEEHPRSPRRAWRRRCRAAPSRRRSDDRRDDLLQRLAHRPPGQGQGHDARRRRWSRTKASAACSVGPAGHSRRTRRPSRRTRGRGRRRGCRHRAG